MFPIFGAGPQHTRRIISALEVFVWCLEILPRCNGCANSRAHTDRFRVRSCFDLSRVRVDVRLSSEEAISELSADLGVEALPAFRFYNEGEEVVEPVMGYKKKLLRAAVENLQKKA